MTQMMPEICQSCANITENIYGQYCKYASHDTNEYGFFWRSNECLFDPSQPKFKNLFTPSSLGGDTAKLAQVRLEFQGYKNDTQKIIQDLKNTIHALTKENQ
jgi:hypothetical protein